MTNDNAAARFWAKVDIRGDDECWLWIASLNTNGYGQFEYLGRPRPAPRIALELSRGEPLPPGRYALHTCDNRRCCNPQHLYEGSLSDNTQDMLRRGRNRNAKGKNINVGSANGNSKLNEDKVRAIRASDLSVERLAAEYDVCRDSIRFILRRKTWKHV